MRNLSKKNRIVLAVILIAAITISIIGSVAFFTSIANNDRMQTANLKTGKISVVFEDADANVGIVGGALNVGDSVTKYFTIENTGTLDAIVRMYWNNLINTYTIGSLTYTLSYSTTKDGNYSDLETDRSIPRSEEPSKKMFVDDITVPVGTKYYYKLVITFNNLKNINQDKDIDAIFSSTFSLEETPGDSQMIMAVYDYEQNTIYKEKLWAHKSDIIRVVFENRLSPKENADYSYDISSAQNGSVMSYIVPDTLETGKYIAYIQANGVIRGNTNSSNLFGGFSSLQTIENMEYFDTSKVTNMSEMFSMCESLTTLDLSNFNTSNVIDMNYIFSMCESLTTLDLSNFDTSKVTNMSGMFSNCISLTSLDLRNFDTSKVTNMEYMFADCSTLKTLDLSNFDTSNVTSMRMMFYSISLTTLDLSNFDTGNVTDMYMMFRDCSSLTTLNVSNFDTRKVTNMASMFSGCYGLTTLDVRSFDTRNVIDMKYMFNMCEGLTTLDLSNFDTNKVTNMYGMFNYCISLTSLDVSNFDTSKVTNMEFMFSGCSSLTTLDLSNFDTSNVTSMMSMFAGCSSLTTTITIKGISCTSYSSMFNLASTEAGAKITLNYTSETSNLVDSMIATKSSNSNIVKGLLVS